MTDPIAVMYSNQYLFNIPAAGTYYFVITLADSSLVLQPYTLTLTTPCQNPCLNLNPNPTSPPPSPTPSPCHPQICGDSILDPSQQCDNGNKPGCSTCLISQGYQCEGNIGSSSICRKLARCGDMVVDGGEECDNGDREGCVMCRVADGYRCVGGSGGSVCGFCGNGVVEVDEECDNKNGIGCSKNCKVDKGFICRGQAASFCYRTNPECGNTVIEVGEACDDSNKIPGDGCSPSCSIENEYTCSGQPSQCIKKLITCGNSRFQPSNSQQCDNGNKDGCIGCLIQPNWQCANQIDSPSVCSPLVVIPHCGDGVFEPLLNQICDDGNVDNGDGCNSFCQIEYGWVCIDNRQCVNTQDVAQMKVFCGNGRLEPEYGQKCDDGDTIDGDGCNSLCKIQDGWECRLVQNRSLCSRQIGQKGYCGNGVLDSNEACDDGFPLRNGDGCSIKCQVEDGWNCQNNSKNQVSRCWRK